MTKKDKIQHLLITHLKKNGSIKLVLPDGILVEIGITKEGSGGDVVIDKNDDYCWVKASRFNNEFILDSFNLGLSYEDNPSTILVEDVDVTEDGVPIKRLEIV